MKTWNTYGMAATLAVCGVGFGACQDKGGEGRAGTNIEVKVAPLTLDDVGDARWRVTVENGGASPEVVWTRELTSGRFGNGQGDVSYVGPCDASPGFENHTVTLELLELMDSNGVTIPTTDWQNPTQPEPLRMPVVCRENADTPVTFNVTVMRRAKQGFFDMAVNFDNVFCSAKMDCAQDFLLYPSNDPQGRTGRGPTAIMAFACTAGSDANGERPTHLYLNEVKISCPRPAPAPPVVVWVHPDGEPGNLGAQPPLLWQSALYFGREGFEGIQKCFWNLALGIELDQISDGPCEVTVAGTASSSPLPNHQVGLGNVWPVVHWDVSLDVVNGELTCGQNPLDGDASGVYTEYVGPDEATRFTYELACGTTTIDPLNGCSVPHEGKDLEFLHGVSGLNISWGNEVVTAAPYQLPAGLMLAENPTGAGCCTDGCCQ